MEFTEQRAISSKVSADGIGLVGAMAGVLDGGALETGRGLSKFHRHEVIQTVLPVKHEACMSSCSRRSTKFQYDQNLQSGCSGVTV